MKWPDNAYAFAVIRRTDIVDGTERFKGKVEQVGPHYYHPDSKIETFAEVEKNPHATRILLDNMRCNKWDKLVWARWGNWPQPYREGEIVVLPKPEAKQDGVPVPAQ